MEIFISKIDFGNIWIFRNSLSMDKPAIFNVKHTAIDLSNANVFDDLGFYESTNSTTGFFFAFYFWILYYSW